MYWRTFTLLTAAAMSTNCRTCLYLTWHVAQATQSALDEFKDRSQLLKCFTSVPNVPHKRGVKHRERFFQTVNNVSGIFKAEI